MMNKDELIINLKAKLNRMVETTNDMIENEISTLYDKAYNEAYSVAEKEVSEELEDLREISDEFENLKEKLRGIYE